MLYTKKPVTVRICSYCGKQFRQRISYQRFCSSNCRKIDSGSRCKSRFNGLPTGTVGALGELEVCCDLLKKHYAVYRAVSPACKCDLVAFANGKPIMVEVTTGYTGLDGRVSRPKKDKSIFDVLAICTENGIIYEPKLEANEEKK